MLQYKGKKIYLIEYFLPFYLILVRYGYGFLTIGTIAMLVVGVFSLLRYKVIYVSRPLVLMLIYMTIHFVMKMVLLHDVPSYYINNFLDKASLVIAVMIVSQDIDEDRLYLMWKIIGFLVMCGLFYQAYLVYGLGQEVFPIRILPMPTETFAWTRTLARPMSVFTEPAAYVSYMIPLLYLSLRKKNIVFSILITISILLSTSTTGLIMIFVVWVSYFIANKRLNPSNVIMLILIVVGLFSLTQLSIFDKTMQKLENTEIEDNQRLTRGYQIFAQLPMQYMIFGVPYTNVVELVKSKEVTMSVLYDNEDYQYVNTASNMLITYGVVGGAIYLAVFMMMFMHIDRSIIPIILTSFIAIFGQSVFFNATFGLQFILIFGLTKNKESNRMFMRAKIF